jgi:hypothetical protein
MSPLGRHVTRAACLVVAALLIAACGAAASKDGVATLAPGASSGPAASTSPSAASEEDVRKAMLAYSQCMRDHGVANFPDPKFDEGGGVSLTLPEGVGPDSPTMQVAETACEGFRPRPSEGGAVPSKERYEQALKFAECMRSHGVRDFPDPQMLGGGATVQRGTAGGPDGAGGGPDPNSPAMQAALQTCQTLLPGGAGAPRLETSGGRP